LTPEGHILKKKRAEKSGRFILDQMLDQMQTPDFSSGIKCRQMQTPDFTDAPMQMQTPDFTDANADANADARLLQRGSQE
jgi:hypothetical protein